MSNLTKVFIFKISATIIFWCAPLILLPADTLVEAGLPRQESWMFLRMLGWAYLALCVGYYFGLEASLQGKKLMGPIWVGIVSNGGASAYLFYYGLSGAWSNWSAFIQFVGWASALATALITAGLFIFGVRGDDPVAA